MKITPLMPGLEVEPSDNGKLEFWSHEGTNMRILGNTLPVEQFGVPKFTGKLIDPGIPQFKPIQPAYDFLRGLYPKLVVPEPMKDGDWKDNKPDTNRGGEARRSFCSRPFYHHLQGNPQGLEALRSWNRDQLLRPYFHNPWKATGSEFARNILNEGTDKEFKLGGEKVYDDEGVGRTSGDIAHGEWVPQIHGAACGDPVAMTVCALQIRAFVTEAYLTTTWRGQERGPGHYLPWLSLGYMLGIGEIEEFRDTFLMGVDLRTALANAIWVMRDNPEYNIWKAYKYGGMNGQCMPDISSEYPDHLMGNYTWQSGILHYGCAITLMVHRHLARLGKQLLLKADVEFLEQILDVHQGRNLYDGWVDGQGMIRAVGHQWWSTQEEADFYAKEALRITPKKGPLFSRHTNPIPWPVGDPIQGGWRLQEAPRLQDTWLNATPASLWYGPEHELPQWMHSQLGNARDKQNYTLVMSAALEGQIEPLTAGALE